MKADIAIAIKESLNGASREWTFSGSVDDSSSERAVAATENLIRGFFGEYRETSAIPVWGDGA